MKKVNKKGFTLVELLTVVLIVVILATIGLPAYHRAVLKAHTAEVNNLLSMVRTRQNINYSKNHAYADDFLDPSLQKIALGPTDYEKTEPGTPNIKTVNTNYELEIVNTPATENTPAQSCVIGRYRPVKADGTKETKFTLAIAYTKNGLACEDGPGIGWSVCKSLGDAVVSTDLSEVCAGQAYGQESCPNTCAPCYYQDMDTCACEPVSVDLPNSNYTFDENVPGTCMSCKYRGESCQNASPTAIPVEYTIDTTNHTINANPGIIDTIFQCTDVNLALGDTTPVGCAEEADGHCLKYLYNCHSAYYKRWNCSTCQWFCDFHGDEEAICNGEQVWNNSTCSCTCRPGSRCVCHVTQKYIPPSAPGENENCECLAPEAYFISKDEGCGCEERMEQFGESRDDRTLNFDYTHCICRPGRNPVFFGTLTGQDGQQHVVDIADAATLAAEDPMQEWLAGCCRNDEYWDVGTIPGFNYAACCPNASYKEDNDETGTHIEFNVSATACCSAQEPFYHYTDDNGTPEALDNGTLNPQYAGRSSGSYQANICHKCKKWFQAYHSDFGCHACPGKTWTDWDANAKVATCSCPTGTDGNPVVVNNGQVTENCDCRKDNTHWDSNVTMNSNNWHAANGACQCNSGFFDTYYGYSLDASFTATIPFSTTVNLTDISTLTYDSIQTGYCCPNKFKAPVFDGNNNEVSNTYACCPKRSNGQPSYFHASDFAGNKCGACQNQTDTYINGHCQPCPAGMVPEYNASLGYSVCKCPTGTHPKAEYASLNGTATAQEGICECDLENATWTLPSGVTNANFVNAYANNTLSSLSGWNNIHGFCVCDANYALATRGVVDGNNIPTSGYCCPTTQDNPAGFMWTASNYNYCCDSNVAFFPENPQERCCATPYYHSYQTLSEKNLIFNASFGGCGKCPEPEQTWIENPENGQDNCQYCEAPRVPIWNNNILQGYSNCQCPSGSHEVQEGETNSTSVIGKIKAFFMDLLGYGAESTEVQSLTQIMAGCKCNDDQAVWVLENGQWTCGCPAGLTMSVQGVCCPNGWTYFYIAEGDTEPSCQPCPQDTPYAWSNWSSVADCQPCPEEAPNYINGTCCSNNPTPLTEGGNVYVINSQYQCSVCPPAQVLLNGVCTQANSITGCNNANQFDETTNTLICDCVGGVTWTSTTGCDCDSTQYENEECACNKCIKNSPLSWLEWRNGICTCVLPHRSIFNTSCCENPSASCCSCNSGYVDTTIENTEGNSGCCLQSLAFTNNEGTKVCCPSDRPYFVNNQCSKCAQNYYYNTSTGQCERCIPPAYNILGGWNSSIGAYTSCSCPAGTTRDGQGGQVFISNTSTGGPTQEITTQTQQTFDDEFVVGTVGGSGSGGGGSSSYGPLLRCYCPYANMVWNSSSSSCVCAEGMALLDNNYNPCSQANGGTCQCRACPAGTIWYENLHKCVKCYNESTGMLPENYIVQNGQCVPCPDIRYVDEQSWSDTVHGYTQCKCPAGMTSGASTIWYSQVNNCSSTLAFGGLNATTPYNATASTCYCQNSSEQYSNMDFEMQRYCNTSSATNTAQCRSCPAGAIWKNVQQGNSYVRKCVCTGDGFDLVDGVCKCDTLSGKHMFSTVNLKVCSAGELDCVCDQCPTGTHWVEGVGCECVNSYTDSNNISHSITGAWSSNYSQAVPTGYDHINPGPGTSVVNGDSYAFYNVIYGPGNHTGYCVFGCKANFQPMHYNNNGGYYQDYNCGTCEGGVCTLQFKDTQIIKTPSALTEGVFFVLFFKKISEEGL